MGKAFKEHYLKNELYDLIKTDSTFFDFIQAGSLDGIWYWNLENTEDEWLSPKFWEVLGYDPKNMKHKSSEWQNIIFEEDLKNVEENFKKHCSDPTCPFDQIVRYKHKNGSTVWIRCRGIAVRDENGIPIRMLGAHLDITKVKESEQRFEILHNASFGGIAVHDQGLILECNQGLSEITGYAMSELIGMNGLLLIAPEQRDFVMQKISSGFEKSYETQGIRKNKEVYPIKIESRNIPYNSKQVRVTEFRDLSELKNEERAKHVIEEQYRLLTTEMPLGLNLREIILDDKGEPIDYRFLSANESYEKITGLKRENIVGKTALEVLPNLEKVWIKTYGKVALTGASIQFEEYSIALGKYFRVAAYSPKKGLFAVIVDDITKKIKSDEEIIRVSKHDHLTGLPNRRYFDEKLKALDHPDFYPLLVSMIDIDGLKLINDAYGHKMGDVAIKQVADTISKHIRSNDFVARIGGDEFVMLCPNTEVESCKLIRNNILKDISNIQNKGVSLSLSFGFSIKSNKSVQIDDVLIQAENDMYAHKVMHGQSSRNQLIMVLFNTLIDKYEEEKLHSNRVSMYSKMMGEELGLTQNEILELEFAGKLHDIGKITIPDAILDKPGKLTDEEWSIMKTHTINGYQILRSADKYSRLAEYALTHHERWDGKGYPNGLMREDIPLYSRIISIADAYEAMTADRPYRKAMDHQSAVEELYRCAGYQFDKELVEIFVKKVLKFK